MVSNHNGGMTVSSPLTTVQFEGLARLDHLGVIEASGADAVNFLHGQLTQDLALLDMQHARLAALCTAKGRMLASFVLFKTSQERVLLVCPRDILATTMKRLSMFVLRAKCKLCDVSDQFHILGAAGKAAHPPHQEQTPPWQLWRHGQTHWVSLYPTNGCPRALGLLAADQAAPATQLSNNDWQLSEVLSGVATITQPVVEAFVPQMLNYESVGGVNFKKGCYPGQEVVARSQFRGTLKRRAYLVSGPGGMQAGQEIFSTDDPEQPCGIVAQAAAGPQGGVAIASLQVSAADAALHLGPDTGAALQLLPLPYSLIEV
jgi:folate-binding protein YgfZ